MFVQFLCECHVKQGTKQQSKQFAESGGAALKQVKLVASTSKVMTSDFWDAITCTYYIHFLDHLKKFVISDLDCKRK